jgi:hypothetical protein
MLMQTASLVDPEGTLPAVEAVGVAAVTIALYSALRTEAVEAEGVVAEPEVAQVPKNAEEEAVRSAS